MGMGIGYKTGNGNEWELTMWEWEYKKPFPIISNWHLAPVISSCISDWDHHGQGQSMSPEFSQYLVYRQSLQTWSNGRHLLSSQWNAAFHPASNLSVSHSSINFHKAFLFQFSQNLGHQFHMSIALSQTDILKWKLLIVTKHHFTFSPQFCLLYLHKSSVVNRNRKLK